MKIKYYTDGGCNSNKLGAWGCICIIERLDAKGKPETRELIRQTSTEQNTTSNRMELWAGYVALTKAYNVVKNNYRLEEKVTSVEIYSDSIYLINGINRNWLEQWKETGYKNRKGEQVKNLDVWKQIMKKVEAIRKTDAELIMIKCDAHNGVPYNEEVDRLVKEELKAEATA